MKFRKLGLLTILDKMPVKHWKYDKEFFFQFCIDISKMNFQYLGLVLMVMAASIHCQRLQNDFQLESLNPISLKNENNNSSEPNKETLVGKLMQVFSPCSLNCEVTQIDYFWEQTNSYVEQIFHVE